MAKPKSRAKSAPAKAAKLTQNQENFAQDIFLGFTGADAYRRNYDVQPDTKFSTIYSQASRLLSTPKIAARVQWLRDLAAAENTIQRGVMLAEMGANRALALGAGKLSVAATSSLARARVAGLLDKAPPPPPPAAPEDAPDMVNAELSQEERTLNEIGRRVYFTLELGKRRGKTKVKVGVEENSA